jgi:hypothetical protein
MNAGAEARANAEFLKVCRGEICDQVGGGEEAVERAGIPPRLVAQRPGDDHLVAHIGVHFSVEIGDWLITLKKNLVIRSRTRTSPISSASAVAPAISRNITMRYSRLGRR